MTLQYGDPDGHGVHGQLTTGADGGLICHECGQERQFLGRHVREHGMSADQYRERHGLGRATRLVSARLHATLSTKGLERVGSPAWARFEAARDPDAAREEARQALKEPLRPQSVQSWTKEALAAAQGRKKRFCEVPGCGRPHAANGLCRTHRERLRRTGDVQAHIPVRPRKGGPGSKKES